MYQSLNEAGRWLAAQVNRRLTAVGQMRMTAGEQDDLLPLYEEDLAAHGRSPAVVRDAVDWVVREREKRPTVRGRVIPKGTRQPQSRKRATGLEWHEWAVTQIFTAHANNDELRIGVKAFREEVLNGRLVPFTDEGIQQWIAQHDTRTAHVRGTTREYLSYGLPSSDWMLRVPTTPGSVLDRLRRLSERLAEGYDWDAGQATIFTLTAASPVVHAIRSSIHERSPLRARSRITLVVDPTCTPQEVADKYRRVRAQFGIPRRLRRIGERHARLAVFAVEHPDPPGPTMMAGWNTWCRKNGRANWTYTHLSQFLREAQRACDAITEFLPARASRRSQPI